MRSRKINDSKIVSHIRGLGIDMIHSAKSGHPGIVLGAAPILYTLYAKHMRFEPTNPTFINRDRFVMSSGHGSALLYSILYMAGFDLTLDDLKNFRQIDSKTPGHPEYGKTCGIDATTGLLGEGLGTAVGIAIAEAKMGAEFNKSPNDLINFNTYVLCGDGDLEEGISYEAASLAGSLKLNKLIVLYDSNNTSLDGNINNTFTENIESRFTAMNWNYIKVSDGEDVNAISKAITEAKKSVDKPTLIEVKTTIGKFSKYEGTSKVHGGDLDEEDISAIKEKLNLRDIPFNVAKDVIEDFQKLVKRRDTNFISDFEKKYKKLSEDKRKKLDLLINNNYQIDIKDFIYEKPDNNIESLTSASSKILSYIVKHNSFVFGGSTDVFKPTKTYVEDVGDFTSKNYYGKNIYFGVRERLAAAAINGIALTGYRPYLSLFLVFSDYLRPSLRMASLMDLPVTYIFTHDSISLGQDGATHQPIEQLANLRTIPNLEVFRPCDANEVIGVYKTIMKKEHGPSIISLSKNELPILDSTNSTFVEKGAYIVKQELRKLDGIIISTGEEVHLAMEVSKRLYTKGIDIRIVSMPSINRFLEQKEKYIEEILPVGIKKIVIEAGSSASWHRLIFNSKYLITLDQFGSSGTKEQVYKKYGFDIDSLEEKVEELLK